MNQLVPSKYLIDGIDRLGKSSLIKMIQQELGYHLVIHYDKPQLLTAQLELADLLKRGEESRTEYDVDLVKTLTVENLARRMYQLEANKGMFDLLKTKIPLIFDRTHLGEMVYSPLYRKYSGDYVYAMEWDMIQSKPYTVKDDVRLILLTSSNTEMLQDDGLSFDPAKKEEEQELFISAFQRSSIPNKIIVDVHNGNGGYRSYQDIFEEAVYKKVNQTIYSR